MNTQYNGDQAIAYGAIAGGVQMVTGYPGSPSTGTMNTLIEQAGQYDLYVEWSTNERVAAEMAIGASIAGRRALVCTKSVGMNVMLDPLMCLNLTGVHGGLVVLLGDDPGAYGSQNDQDTRQLAYMLELPILEPATPAQAYIMMQAAFDLSERFNTAIIIRETRAFSQFVETFEISPISENRSAPLGLVRDPYRFVPYPGNAVEMHRQLHQRLAAFETWACKSEFNEITGKGPKGILTTGFASRKLLDVLGDQTPDEVRILSLSCLYPLPTQLINRFATGCEEILVLEEVDPFVETQLKAALYDLGTNLKIRGKRSGHVSWGGELFRWHIQDALAGYLPAFKPKQPFLAEREAAERPPKVDHCAKYPYEVVLDALLDVAHELNRNPLIIADPGCMVKVAEQLDAKFAIGSAVAVASGIRKAGVDEKVVAFFGDSAFFHSALPAICNAAYNQSDVLIVLMDNAGAASTGLQPTPATGVNALGKPAPNLNIPAIARACGVSFISELDAGTTQAQLRKALHDGLGYPGLAMLIAQFEPGGEPP